MRVYKLNEINEISFELLNDKAAIIETDTVMGIISKDENLIYKIKNRPRNKKIITFVSRMDDVLDLNEEERELLKSYWPGALTIIKNNKSYRMPNHPQLLKIIERVGPIYSSSANISGEEPINNHLEAIKKFEKFANKLIIVEGKKISNLPSTIYSFDTKKEIRKGNININVIMKK